MPGTVGFAPLDVSMSSAIEAEPWWFSTAGKYWHGLIVNPPVTGHSFASSGDNPGGDTFNAQCDFSNVSSRSGVQSGVVFDPEVALDPVDGIVGNALGFSQTSGHYLRLSASVSVFRSPIGLNPVGTEFGAFWTIQNSGDPVGVDWLFNRRRPAAAPVRIDRAALTFFVGTNFIEEITVSRVGVGGIPLTVDLRVAYLPQHGAALHDIIRQTIPTAALSYRYFDVTMSIDVVQPPEPCPAP